MSYLSDYDGIHLSVTKFFKGAPKNCARLTGLTVQAQVFDIYIYTYVYVYKYIFFYNSLTNRELHFCRKLFIKSHDNPNIWKILTGSAIRSSYYRVLTVSICIYVHTHVHVNKYTNPYMHMYEHKYEHKHTYPYKHTF